ncbi:MAG: hypothetical protein ABJE95_14995 [Byssovorax sp.]
MSLRRSLSAALGLAFALGLPARALAQAPPAPFTLIDDEAEIGKDHPAAPDMRTGHLYVLPRLSVVAPAGKLAAAPETSPNAGTPTSQLAGTGAGFGAMLGVGVARHAVIEAVAQYTRFGAPTACTGCSGSGVDLGIGLSYHLAQGIAIDPWVSYGVGLRFATFHSQPTSATGGPTGLAPIDQAFRGVDVARLALGADFYPIPRLGLGPFFEADIGTAFSRANPSRADPALGPAAYGFFQVGLRIAFDPFQRPLREPRTEPRVSARR